MTGLGRRSFLGATAALAGLASHRVLAADHSRLTLAMDRDIQGALDPADRLSFTEGNIIRAVCQGLIEFKPGTFDWQNARRAVDQAGERHRHQLHAEAGPRLPRQFRRAHRTRT